MTGARPRGEDSYQQGVECVALEHLADEELDLLIYIRELEADARAYRELAHAALDQLHALVKEMAALKAMNRRINEVVRKYIDVHKRREAA